MKVQLRSCWEEFVSQIEMRGHINDVELIEVTLDASLNTTPVEGGACYRISGQVDFDTIPGG